MILNHPAAGYMTSVFPASLLLYDLALILIGISKQCTDLGFCVKALLANGSRVNAANHLGETALLKAADHGRLEIVQVSS